MTDPTLRPIGRKRKQPEKPTLETLQKWFLLAWYPLDSELESIEDYAYIKLQSECEVGNTFADKTLDYLSRQLHKCPARSQEQLRRWCYKQIDKQAERLSKSERRQRRDTKTFPGYEQDGNVHIPLTDAHGQEHVLKIPADFVEQARTLWPVHIRWYADGKAYAARKTSIILPGERKQTVLPAHHAFLWFKYPGIGDGDISCSRARNGDFLDWTGNNLFVPSFDGKSVCQSTRDFRIERAIYESSRRQLNVGNGYATAPVSIDKQLIAEWERKLAEGTPGDRDILDCSVRADLDVEQITLGGVPAKPTRPAGQGPDVDDHKAWLDSAFMEGVERNTLAA